MTNKYQKSFGVCTLVHKKIGEKSYKMHVSVNFFFSDLKFHYYVILP